ncbi:RDD family protein [Streptomyces polygonati]|uniref:RDD family protein n=1 Tax=Streptomyces polygonati TaxID=1617087 RepID=A0ABV8HZP8_9ACTN
MSSDQPGPGPDDPFVNRPGEGGSRRPDDGGAYGDGPYGAPPPGRRGPGDEGGGPYDRNPNDQSPYDQNPYDRNPYDQDPYGGGRNPGDPMAGMPPLAAAGKRVLARLIDIIIVLIPAFLLEWGTAGLEDSNGGAGRSAVSGLFAAGLGYLYEWYTTRSTGQTLGKKMMGIRTAMLSDGSVPTPAAAAVRAGVLWVPVLLCYCVWFLIIGITVFFDKPYKQGLQDRLAKTVVVEIA